MASSSSAPPLGNLVRLTPLLLNELPPHPSIPDGPLKSAAPGTTTTTTNGSSPPEEPPRPSLLAFLLAILDEGSAFLSPSTFSSTFTPHGTKSSAPSTSKVEVLKRDISAAQIENDVAWDSPPVPRRKPQTFVAEHWFARRSRHANISSKEKEGSANWDEFVFGLRDQHSKHEQDFTPTLYDAHHILDWNDEVRALEKDGKLEGRYSKVTMSIYEMCHAIPPPLSPRCFPVLVVTASTSPTSFIAVTVPVDITSLPCAFYSNGTNVSSATSSQQRKRPVLGVYNAIETTYIDETDGQITWTMATASDAKGVLPMAVQKMSLPGAIAKDVGFFLKWIPTVSRGEIAKQPEASTS